MLQVKQLTTKLKVGDQTKTVVDDLSFTLEKGKTLAIVGESGSGKSMTALSIMRILPDPPALPPTGEVTFNGQNLLDLSIPAMRKIRGAKIAMIFQDPMSCLNPVYTVGDQLLEVVRLHLELEGKAAHERVVEALANVGIPLPAERFYEYPHQLSGGMRQRVMIAMALLCEPDVLIADEPTTALDVTVQAGVLDLMRDLQAKTGMAILLITHDMGVVAELAHDVVVMKEARAVERGPIDQIFDAPAHPYTQALFAARPSITAPSPEKPPQEAPLLAVNDLKKHFDQVRAVDGITFSVQPGQVLGMVGESGCGKSTAARAAIRLIEPTSGSIAFDNQNFLHLPPAKLRQTRQQIQMVFQNPFASLNPRKNISENIGEALLYHKVVKTVAQRDEKVADILTTVGLSPDDLTRYPHQFSGGQQQRICIGRALALDPKLIVCDEVVSALDVSIQAQILDLLTNLKTENNLAYLFISHDLAVVRQLCDEVVVLYLGQIVERASTDELFNNPKHPYTQVLLSAIPRDHPREQRERIEITGELPSPKNPPAGCPFHTRCPLARTECREGPPPLKSFRDGNGEVHEYRCVL
jgi:peptide/nickel transport system ATP-binding protein